MARAHDPLEIYVHPDAARIYDQIFPLFFVLFGGLESLRKRAIDFFGIASGSRVLELGCGTGGITRLLLARGATVVGVDNSESMMVRARTRAQGATLVHSDVTTYQPTDTFDAVVFPFLLHELEKDGRHDALRMAGRALAPGGKVCILDHGRSPHSGWLARRAEKWVLKFERPCAAEWIDGDYDSELRAAGLLPVSREYLAGGTVVAIVCKSDPSTA